MLYPRFKVNKLIKKEILWDTQKSTEEEEKWAQENPLDEFDIVEGGHKSPRES